jgi:HSP20 family protein
MMKINDLTNSLNRTWESISHGWNQLINRAGNALTHFRRGDEQDRNNTIPVQSPHWGLLNADVFDDANKLVVKLEVPGLTAEDIDISVVDNVLLIGGEKRFEREETKGDYRLLECAYGSFSRSIPLGYDVDADTAKATYDKGVLKITLEKKPHQRRRKIEVS